MEKETVSLTKRELNLIQDLRNQQNNTMPTANDVCEFWADEIQDLINNFVCTAPGDVVEGMQSTICDLLQFLDVLNNTHHTRHKNL